MPWVPVGTGNPVPPGPQALTMRRPSVTKTTGLAAGRASGA